ncbi:hypothetical protein F4803DRAFT_135803 [Xylaria telfairii]|nr:hypothetical protein F4803DRAFT_135803 [Xylaria telfairii]
MPHHRASFSSADSSQYGSGSSTSTYSSAMSTSTSISVPDTHTAQFAPNNLPCEFVGYSSCDQTFAMDDVENWIEHIISEHLQEKLPKRVVCWFCDEWIFDYKTVGDRRVNFENRMWHIRDHFLDGMTAHRMRPDHHLNAHLQSFGLIPEHAYHVVRRYAEVPQGNWILPHDSYPAEWEDKNARGEREYNSPLEEQRKNRKNRHKSGKSRK